MVRGSVQWLAGKIGERLLQWRRWCVPWRHGSTPCSVHWHVLHFMRRQRGGADCGRAVLAAAGRLLHSLAKTATCGPPRLRPGPVACTGHRPATSAAQACACAWALLLLPLATSRQDGDLRPSSPAPLPAARWFALGHVGGLRIGFSFAALHLKLSAGLAFSSTTAR